MKKYFLFIAGLIILLFNSRSIAQHISVTALKRLIVDMNRDSTDRWEYGGGPDLFTGVDKQYDKYAPQFNVWVKARSTDGIGRWVYVNPLDSIRHPVYLLIKGYDLSAQIYNAATVELATTSITPENANKYQYRVVGNDSLELTPWTTPAVFRSNKFKSYAYLGNFNFIYKTITLTIAEKNNKNNQSVYVYANDNIPRARISSMEVQYRTGLSARDASDWGKGFGILAQRVEQINLSITNRSKNELYHVYLKRNSAGKDTTFAIGNNWEHNLSSPDPAIHISSTFFTEPGRYTIIIRPEISIGNRAAIIGAEARAQFITVAPPATLTLPVKTAGYIVVILLTTGGFMFMMYRRRQQQKLAREAQNKRIATLQLQSVRAQLNPHFIFNALAGIQNLINKNAIEDANKYLTRFARLTRNVLDDGQKELITIEKEISLLTDYLLMEQTRFGFNFNIEVDEQLDWQIEIPAMLLQPFIENAVKHGISALKNEGQVNVGIARNGDDIILTVKDNGKGFSTTENGGLGIKLCRDRIALFNSIYKNTVILLQINPDETGTIITIELKNWL